MTKKIITRFAPSPTGFMHVGSLRTALYNFIFAKKNHGSFFLRIEDTDQTRKVTGATESLFETLKKFDLLWDNTPPMVQSERLATYQKYASQLVHDDKAYYCFCTQERLEELKTVQQQRKLPPMYDGHCRTLDSAVVKKNLDSGIAHVIRFKMPKTGSTEFIDVVRGKVSFDNKVLDDQIILKSDGFPTYHLASVVDDHEMAVTHVIRGEEWLPSTPKHLLLYEAFSWEKPEFAHLPLLLNPDRSKLSKRQGDVAVEDYLAKGYLPQALLNFVLLLGWNPGTDQELFSLDEMITVFSLKKVNKAGAVFNTTKLDWLNSMYIKQLEVEHLAELAKPFYAAAGIDTKGHNLIEIVATEKTRIKKLGDLVEATKFFFEELMYDPSLLIWKNASKEKTLNALQEVLALSKKIPEKKWTSEHISQEITELIERTHAGVGDVLWPLRVALTGRKASPGPFEVASALGKEKTIQRIAAAIRLLEK